MALPASTHVIDHLFIFITVQRDERRLEATCICKTVLALEVTACELAPAIPDRNMLGHFQCESGYASTRCRNERRRKHVRLQASRACDFLGTGVRRTQTAKASLNIQRLSRKGSCEPKSFAMPATRYSLERALGKIMDAPSSIRCTNSRVDHIRVSAVSRLSNYTVDRASRWDHELQYYSCRRELHV